MKKIFVCFGLLILFVSSETWATNIPPIADFNIIYKTGQGVKRVDFDAGISSDPDGTIASYAWNFSDGVTTWTNKYQIRMFEFWDVTYTATLTVTDNLGATHSVTKSFTVKDTQAPILSIDNALHSSNIYVQSLPYVMTHIFNSNEELSRVYVGGEWYDIINFPLPVIRNQTITTPGQKSIVFGGEDMVGNYTTTTFYFWVILDNTAPVIEVLPHASVTNKATIPLSFLIKDDGPVQTEIKVNGSVVTVVDTKTPSYTFNLPIVGNNTFEVKSTDAAGNVSAVTSFTIVRDNVVPDLSGLTPTNSSIVDRVAFEVSGNSNKPLSEIYLNSTRLTLNPAKTSFTGIYSATTLGTHSLVWKAKDLAGNEVIVNSSISVEPRLLIPELVSIVPSQDGQSLIVLGSKGATRAGAEISASEGLLSWNKGSQIANADGEFKIKLDPFSSVRVTAYDPVLSQTATLDLTYTRATTLSGVVKDSDNNPLPGVTVSMNGATTTTDGSGIFAIAAPKTGDQTIVFDGSTISPSITGPNKKFTKTNIVISIGVGQSNVLSRPIYMVPLMLDGTETLVATSAGGTVTSTHAPGVALSIPSGSANFPGGGSSGNINLKTINASRSTIEVPQGAVPTNVIALEPSGMRFSERVELTLPNDNELPAGVEFAIFSMNSTTGAWEVDGVAKVTPDGQSVRTKEGQGISHFSLVYAVPLAPTILEMGSSSIAGINVAEDSLGTSVALPSVKVGAADFAPSLTYKSAWAKPTALVSNMFHIPEKKTHVSFDQSAGTLRERMVLWGETCFIGICNRQEKVVMKKVEMTDHIQLTSWYLPESIKSQFYIGGISTDDIAFVDVQDPSIVKLPGPIPQQATATTIVEYTGIPSKSVISYAVPLKKKNGDYLKTGIYPSVARYQIQLKNMVITTGYRTAKVTVDGENIPVPPGESSTTVTSRVLDEIFPSDVKSTVLVQNKIESAYGRGWHLNATQKILNPSGNTILIEEANGDLSTYVIDNTINRVFNGIERETSLDYGIASLKQWPYAYVSTFDRFERSTSLAKIDLSTVEVFHGDKPLLHVQEVPMSSGVVGNLGWKVCPVTYTGTFKVTSHPFKMRGLFPSLLQAPSGSFVGLSAKESRLIEFSGPSMTNLAGATSVNFQPYANEEPEYLDSWLGSEIMWDPETGATVTTHPCTVAQPSNPNRYSLISTTGSYGSGSDYFLEGFGHMGVNPGWLGLGNPKDLVIAPDGSYIVSDFGNNRVKKFNPATNEASVIMGDGGNIENRLDGLGTDISLYHPTGLVYDAVGNLYVSTGSGHIRVLRPDGSSSWVAGLPLGDGGVVSTEAPAKSMNFAAPYGLAFDNERNFLYVADSGNNRVVRIDLNSGQASVVAGNGTCGTQVPAGSSALLDSICNPTMIAVDPVGNLILVDSGARSIKKVSFSFEQGGKLSYSPSNKDNSKLVRNSDGTWTRTYRNKSKATFSANGLQNKLISSVGSEIEFEYDGSKRLIGSTDQFGQTTTYNYSGDKLSSIVDAASRTTSFSYDGNDLTQITFPDGTSKKYEYLNEGLLTKEINQNNAPTTYVYNQHNRLVRTVNAEGIANEQKDDSSSNVVSGATGILKGVGVGAGEVAGAVQSASGNTTTVARSFVGSASFIKDAKGNITTIESDMDGRPTRIEKPDGNATLFSYDPTWGDLLSVTDEDSGVINSRTFDEMGNVLTETNGRGKTFLKTYYANTNLLESSTSPTGLTVSFSYNSTGLVTSKTVGSGIGSITSLYEYDLKGRVSKITEPSGNYTEYQYDLAGNTTQIKNRKSSGVESLVIQSFDSMNRLISSRSGMGEVTRYEYSPTGKLKKVITPKGALLLYQYNLLDQLVSKSDEAGLEYKYAYDIEGNLSREIDPNSQIRSYAYNELNKILSVNSSDEIVNYEYDLVGNISKISNQTTEVSYARDSRGNVTNVTTVGKGSFVYPSVSLTYGYDNANNRTSVSAAAGSLAYTYDDDNSPTSIQNSWGDTFSYGFDSLKRIATITRPGSVSYFSYSNNLLSGIHHKNGVTIKSFAEYDYDLRNYPVQKRIPAGTIDYSYDLNGQLTGVSGPGSSSENFAYDAVGNRTSDSSGSIGYDNTSNRLSEDTLHYYNYDNVGNLISKIPKDVTKNAYRYTYNSRNQLTKYEVYATPFSPTLRLQATYIYDVLGRRVQKGVLDYTSIDPKRSYGRRYVYDGSNIIFEYNTAGTLLTRYTHGVGVDDVLGLEVSAAGVSAGISASSGKAYYLKDHLNTVTDIINASGDIVQRYEYSGFGKITKITNAAGTDISASPIVQSFYSFTGREYDRESGLYNYRARMYDPALGRFIQEDPHPGSLTSPITINNRYSYANNIPTYLRDPNGEFPILIAIGVAALIGGTVGGINASNNGGNFWMGFASGAAIGAASVLFTAGGAAAATYAASGAFGISVGAGTVGGVLAGAIGGAIGNSVLYGIFLGASGTNLLLAAVSGALSGGLAGAAGMNWGQATKIGTSAEHGMLSGVDSFNRSITPISYPNDPTRYINDLFFQSPNGTWTNGAQPSTGPSLPNH